MNPPDPDPRPPSAPASPAESGRRRDEALVLALDATITSIWDYDVTTDLVTLDSNWSRMCGGPARATTTPLGELFSRLHPEDRLRASRATLACVTGRTSEYSQEYRVRDQFGEWIWVHSRGRVTHHDATGRATRMIGTNMDITQRKTSELAASRQLEFLQALNQTTLALLQRRDKTEILEALAGRAASLLDSALVEVALVAGDELVTYAHGGGVHPPRGRRAGRQEAVLSWRAVDSKRPVIVDNYASPAGDPAAKLYAQFRSGAVFPILLGSQCLGVLGFLRDRSGRGFTQEEQEKGQVLAQLASLVIHNATVYEDAVRMAEQITTDLRASEQLYRSLVESVTQGYYVANRRSLFTYCNPAMHAMGGFAPGELVGQSSFRLVVAEDRARVMAIYKQWINDPIVAHATCEFRVAAKHGRQFWVEQNTDFVRDARGQVIEGRNMLRDISERKQAEEALRHSEAQLRQAQKMESLGTLAGGIAHDFNNILTGILGYAQLGLSDLPSDHPAAQWLEGILKSGERAKDLVHQILTFSRKTESSRSPIRLQLIIRESVGLLRSTLPAMVRLETELDPACPPVLADHTEIHQVVLNLCTNAWHALPEAGGLIQVRLTPHEVDAAFAAAHPPLKPGPHVHLGVHDNGRGMSAATLERIFEPFFTTKEAGKGTGLGLAVVHSVVTAHEGIVLVDSKPGVGTRFDLYLPALPALPPPEPATAAPFLPPPGGGEAVLVVDDEAASGTVIARIIERLGYQTTLCADPFQAVALLYANEYALLVTDLAMPGLPGDELARQALTHRPDLPVLLLSGYIEPAMMEKLRGLGVREILNKPPTYEELASALHRCLHG